MIPYDKFSSIPYGGDYNPEQWPEEIWAEDMRLFKKAGINTVTLNVFSWAALQPSEDVYDFEKLDRIVDTVTEAGLNIIMATSTGAHPAWMALRHPDVLRVDTDGRKRKFGSRHNSCPNSPTYRKYSALLAGKLAERYGERKNVAAWHIANEYSGMCYCERCEEAFREWLRKRYGSIEEVNKAWNTSFWGHTFYDWEEIVAPSRLSEEFSWYGQERTNFQGISIDYRRFMSDSLLKCLEVEKDAILEERPDALVTTNMMGFCKDLDYFKWAKRESFVSWDNYPRYDATYGETAMAHDLMRGVGGQNPFILMEQTPSVSNWHEYCALKRPGVMRLWSYQAMAHGSDAVLFFQMRRTIGACEKYHGAVIDHAGTENTRVFREIAALGGELERLGNRLFGMRTESRIAMIFDWDNWWAVEYSAGPTRLLGYVNEFRRIYEPLRKMNYNVDIISPEDSLGGYDLVIAPVWYMVKDGADERVREYVRSGGSFVTSFFSGYVQDSDLVITGGYPGKLRDILGIWVEELDALPPGRENSFVFGGTRFPAELICDLIHPEGAEELDEGGYESDFYKGMPVVTANRFGEGTAYYLATASSEDFYRSFFGKLASKLGIAPVLETPDGVEAAGRTDGNGRRVVYVLNHSEETKEITVPFASAELIRGEELPAGTLQLAAKDVAILEVRS